MASIPRSLTYKGIPLWRHAKVVQWTLQLASGFLVVVLVAALFVNVGNAIRDRDIPYGFSFLSREYEIGIGQHFLPYDASSDSFLYALLVGATNTVFVSIAGVMLATALGIFVGVSRLSGNWLVSRAAQVYVEFFRNVPLLLQLYFWLFIVLELPQVRQGHVVLNLLFINNGGTSIPWPTPGSTSAALAWLSLAAVGVVVGVVTHRLLARREETTGRTSYPLAVGIATAVAVGVVGWVLVAVAAGAPPFGISTPAPQGAFGRIDGGFTISGGLMALLAGLVIYTSSFIAEIVRAGIQSVGRGQTEAARSVGLTSAESLRFVAFPQALRVIVPPLISQFLNLTKNSSLAGAIGYSDLTNVAKEMTQTAPAVSLFLLIMLAYLAMSLTYSLLGNLYNRRIRFS